MFLLRTCPYSPETMGLPTAITYLITLFLFMPFPFINWLQDTNSEALDTFPYNKVWIFFFELRNSQYKKKKSWEKSCQPY